MKSGIKIGLYLILVACTVFFGIKFFQSYQAVTQKSEARQFDPEEKEPPEQVSETKSEPEGNPEASPGPEDIPDANQDSDSTNAASSQPEEAAAATPPAGRSDPEVSRKNAATPGIMMGYGAAFLGTLAILGLLIAFDVSRYFAGKTEEFLFNDDAKGVADPRYEEAERVWANGDPLEAIRLMRHYLEENPREQYVALRIAEIYEKDLNNPLAAALEYEEILKKKLPAERWGWAAIHLANLYSGKLNKPDEAVALLRKIETDYSQTGAARKARERLARMESDS